MSANTLLAVPEYAEWAAGWSPEKEAHVLSQPDLLERACAGELSVTEELFLLNFARAHCPAEFVWFCRRVIDSLPEEQRSRIEEEYHLRQELYALQREQRRREHEVKRT